MMRHHTNERLIKTLRDEAYLVGAKGAVETAAAILEASEVLKELTANPPAQSVGHWGIFGDTKSIQ